MRQAVLWASQRTEVLALIKTTTDLNVRDFRWTVVHSRKSRGTEVARLEYIGDGHHCFFQFDVSSSSIDTRASIMRSTPRTVMGQSRSIFPAPGSARHSTLPAGLPASTPRRGGVEPHPHRSRC